MLKTFPILARWLAFILLLPFATAGSAEHQKVSVGAYINDIQSIDLRSDSHVMDFYIWFRTKDPKHDPSTATEFMNMVLPDDHTNQSLYVPPKAQPDGSLYTVLHHNGAFSSKFPLQNYPFDVQTLSVELEDTQLGADDLRFVPDRQGITINPSIRLASYQVGTPKLEVRSVPYPTDFGDLSAPNISSYSRVFLTVPVRRPWISGTVKVLLPVGLILLSAVLALLIRPDHIEARISLGITALLTLVALQFTASTELPEVDYLMLIDKVYLASYVFILAVLANVVRGSWLTEEGNITTTARMDRRIGVLLVLLYCMILVALIVPALG